MTAAEMLKTRITESWNKIYALINWKNRPSTATALGATNLNKMDVAINKLDNRVIQLQAEKLGLDVANLMISSWVMDMQTYKITVTQLNGTVKEYDLNLERIPLKVTLSEEGILTFTYADGTNDSVNVADLIKDTVYEESDTITFEKNFESDIYHVTASIKNNSIEERHLKIDVMQDIRNNANIAQTAANDSLTYSKDSKRWAVGDGEYEGSETDNSKYYKEQAEEAKRAAETARDEAIAAGGATIMTPEKIGVGKPDNITIKVTEDGTLSVPEATANTQGVSKPDNTTIGLEDGALKLIATAAEVDAIDTQDIVGGGSGTKTKIQSILDAIGQKLVNKVVTSDTFQTVLAKYLVNNGLTTEAGKFGLDAAFGKNLQDQVTQLNSNLEAGTATIPIGNGAMLVKYNIPFSVIPKILLTPRGSAQDVVISVKTKDISTTGFGIVAVESTSSGIKIPNYPITVDWIAIAK